MAIFTFRTTLYQTHEKTLNRNQLIFWNGSYILVPFDNHEEVSTPRMFPCKSRYFDIESSCNGLVLGSARHVVDRVHKFFVSNLTTRDYVEFPVWWQEFSNGSDERYMTGFGYDSVKDDYKVVTISYIHSYGIPPDETYVHVYSLRNNSWKQMSNSPYDHSEREGYGKDWLRGVFINGFLHWIASKGSDRIPVTVAFSLADEKFSCEVPSPDMNNDADILSHSDCKLVALGDRLGIFHTVEGVVWLMNEYGVKESWKKIVVHGFNEISMYEPKIFYDNRKLLFVTCNTMRIYDLEEGTSLKSVVISKKEYSWVKCAYVESLVSPKLG